MDEALEPNPGAYPTFNAFFTRALRPETRPIVTDIHAIASPADGCISQFGEINKTQILQVKGWYYSVVDLLGGCASRAQTFDNGHFCTIYLAPRDYHRVHMPVDAELKEMIYIPGRLFSVSPTTVRSVPRLFTRNERMVAMFATRYGPMALVMVGAMNVAAIETVWAGLITPPRGSRIRVTDYTRTTSSNINLARGQELGRFNMGSTVIFLFPAQAIEWNPELRVESQVRMGQRLGNFQSESESS